jgi:Rps23 Pro-64 3,4-dihydroxylase Tpa1-like proline 4-hydroxylase
MAAISIDYGTVQVFDDAVPDELYKRLFSASLRVGWSYGWKSTNASARYWHHEISGGQKHNRADVSAVARRHPMKVFGEYLDWLLSEAVPADSTLLRLYLNGHTYGTDGSTHTDTERPGEITIVLYLTQDWKADFGGETVVLDDAGNIAHAVMPKPNRLMTFPSHHVHGPRPLSKIYGGLRTVLVAKFGTGASGGFVRGV